MKDNPEKKNNWKMTPEESDAYDHQFLHEDVQRAVGRSEKNLWRSVGRVGRSEDHRMSTDEGRYYKFLCKPPLVTFGLGLPAIALILGQFALVPLQQPGDWTGLIRLGMIIAGGFCLFIAAPRYVPKEWTPEYEKELEETKDYFQKKRDW